MAVTAAARPSIEALEALNAKARKHAYTLDDLDWARPVDRERYWSPVSITPLSHLPSFGLLGEEHRLRYNQLFAVGVCEQFVWFEQHLANTVLRHLLAQTGPGSGREMPPLLREALEVFIEEEDKHSEMFWRMCEKAEPSFYPERRFHLFGTSPFQKLAQRILLSQPRLFLMWIWVIILFEERTIDYCKQYRKAKKADPALLDENFCELHEFHLQDEGRHYQYDHHLLTWLYDPQPAWKKRLAGRMFARLMKAYTAPRRTSLRILEVLGQEFPELHERAIPALRRELPLLRTSESFHEAAFSRRVLPKSLALFAEYDELDPIWDLLAVEDRRGTR